MTAATSWNLGSLYKSAWNIFKHHPKLWLVGLAVTVLSTTTSTNFGGSSSSSERQEEALPQTEQRLPFTLPNNINEADLSQAFNTTTYRLGTTVFPSLRSLSAYIYIILAVEAVIAMLAGLIAAVIASAWSRGSLIHAIDQAVANSQVDLTAASQTAISKLKTIIGIDILPWLRIMLVVIAAGILAGLSTAFNVEFIIPLVILATLIYSVIYGIGVLFAQIWAYRSALIDNTNFTGSMLTGYSLSRGRKGNMLVLGIANAVIGGLTALVLLIIAGTGPLITILNAVSNPTTQTIIIAGITSLASLNIAYPLMFVRQTFINVFTYTVWNLAYKESHAALS